MSNLTNFTVDQWKTGKLFEEKSIRKFSGRISKRNLPSISPHFFLLDFNFIKVISNFKHVILAFFCIHHRSVLWDGVKSNQYSHRVATVRNNLEMSGKKREVSGKNCHVACIYFLEWVWYFKQQISTGRQGIFINCVREIREMLRKIIFQILW